MSNAPADRAVSDGTAWYICTVSRQSILSGAPEPQMLYVKELVITLLLTIVVLFSGTEARGKMPG